MNEMIPKVSVIMAVNNGEKYISTTIESVLNQSFEDFEFIIAVNCSTDSTLEIIKKYDDPRIRIFENRIPQLGFNLNYALNIARGQYIMRIDADDVCHVDRLKKQIKVIIENGYDVVGSNLTYIDSKGNRIKEYSYPEHNNSIRGKIWRRSVFAHPSVLYKKEAIIKIGAYLGGRASEDYGLWLRLMRDTNIKFYNIQESLTKYRIHSNQSKGNYMPYAEVAGLLLTESIIQRNLLFFLGSIRYFLTSIWTLWRKRS